MIVTVNVTFLGICTHLWATDEQRNALPHPAWGTRIVLANASDQGVIDNINQFYGLNGINGTPIEPHVATLNIFAEEFVSVTGPGTLIPTGNQMLTLGLNGVTVTVPPDVEAGITRDARCMPGLGTFVSDLAPGAAAILADPSLASCYFDFTTGSVLGTTVSTTNNAGSIVYTANTETPPTSDHVHVTIAPFGGGESTVITLAPVVGTSTVNVVISNFPLLGVDDNDSDFVLHYLVAGSFPATIPSIGTIGCPVNPSGSEILARLGGGPFEFGVGCSNSNIP